MKPYSELTREELLALKASLKAEYAGYQERKLSLNMARGKPSQTLYPVILHRQCP